MEYIVADVVIVLIYLVLRGGPNSLYIRIFKRSYILLLLPCCDMVIFFLHHDTYFSLQRKKSKEKSAVTKFRLLRGLCSMWVLDFFFRIGYNVTGRCNRLPNPSLSDSGAGSSVLPMYIVRRNPILPRSRSLCKHDLS